jgi:ribosomal protein L2
MPSGSLYKSTAIFLASNFFKKKTTVITNKSSTFFFKKKRLSVRGVAKNAVDHKHGGKGRGGVLRGF